MTTPKPMLTSEKPCDCTSTVPAKADNAAASPTPAMVVHQTLMPCACAMSRLAPTARSAMPFSVLMKAKEQAEHDGDGRAENARSCRAGSR